MRRDRGTRRRQMGGLVPVLVGVEHSQQGQAQGPRIPSSPPLAPTHAIASFQKNLPMKGNESRDPTSIPKIYTAQL